MSSVIAKRTLPLLAAALACLPSVAAESSSEPVLLEEIIVTAQKRAQSLRDVPISISALGAEELEQRRVNGVEDFIRSVPNANFVNSGAYWGQSVTFRGISNFSGGNYDVIAVTVDDVGYGATSTGAILSSRLNDVERIEVLRGPQGTLSGRNSLGGSINIITRKPDLSKLDGEATLDVSRFETLLGKAAINVPLSPQAAVRVSGFYEHSGGAIKNIGPAGGDSGYDNAGGRAAVRLQPNERLTIDAAVGYENLRRDMEDWITHDFTSSALYTYMTSTLQSWGGAYPGPVDYFPNVGNNGGKVSKDTDEYTRIEDWTASLRASYELDSHVLDLIYGHFDYDLSYVEDYDQTEYAWWNADRARQTRTDSIELRATSSYDGPINWVAGVSYMRETLENAGGDNIGLWAVNGGNPVVGGTTKPAYLFYASNRIESVGLFANAFWDIRDWLHLSAGTRYSIERNRIGDNFVFDIADMDLTLPALADSDYRRSKISRFSPRLALNMDLDDTVTSYLQYSTGYRAGYGNDAQSVGVGASAEVDPEKLDNYEVGVKGRFFGGILNANASLFYMDYRNLQVEALIDPALNPYPFDIHYDLNAGKAHTKGFELEAELRPLAEVSLHAAVGYTKAIVDEVSIDGAPYSNIAIPNVRPWTVSLGAAYMPALTDTLTGDFRIDYTFQDRIYWQGILPDPAYYLPSYQTVDVSAGVRGDGWSATLYFDNVLNEKYYTSIGWVDVGYRGRMVYTPPRRFGLRLTSTLDALTGR